MHIVYRCIFLFNSRSWKCFLEQNIIWKTKEVINLEWKLEEGVLTVYPQGDLDLVTAKTMKEHVENILYSRLGVKNLVVNLKGVRFVDSSGLGMLIGCYKYMQGRQGSMMLSDASASLYRVLELSGMKKLMPILRQDV